MSSIGEGISPIRHKYHAWYVQSESYLKSWRQQREIIQRYRDGDQWFQVHEDELKKRDQLKITLNLIRSSLDAIVNIYYGREVDFRWVGANRQSEVLSDVLIEFSKQVDRINEAGFIQSSVFEDGVSAGAGWIELDYDRIPMAADEDVVVRRVDGSDMGYSPFSRHPVLLDSPYVYRKIYMERDDVIDLYPHVKDKLLKDFPNGLGLMDCDNAQQKAAEMHSRYYQSSQKNGNQIALVDMEYRPDIKNPMEVRKVLFAGNAFLEGGEKDSENEVLNKEGYFLKIPYFAGKDWQGKPIGLGHNLISPQDMINSILSKWEWNVNSNQLDVEKGALPKDADLEETMNLRNAIRKWNPGALQGNKVIFRDNLREATHIIAVLDRIISYIDRTWGGNEAIRGGGGVNARSAEQEATRVDLGAGMQTRVLKNFDYFERQYERVKLMQMAKHYKQDRLIRVLGAKTELSEEQLQKLIGKGKKLFGNAQEALQYDLILESTLPYNSRSQEELRWLSQAANAGALPKNFLAKMMVELSSVPDKRNKLKELEKELGNGQ